MATTCATGSRRTNVINGTTQVFTGRTVVMRLVVTNAATGDSIAVYDDTSGTANPVLEWAFADGKGRFEAQVPISNGIRVVATITSTRAYLVWGV
jgi:type II secretory pathway predicted ATPase ExeA